MDENKKRIHPARTGFLFMIRVAKRFFIRTLVYTAISLFFYIIYPFPPEYVRFVLGAVPIILYAADMSWMVVKMKKG